MLYFVFYIMCLFESQLTVCFVLLDLTVLWLTRKCACLYFVADILSLELHCILLFY